MRRCPPGSRRCRTGSVLDRAAVAPAHGSRRCADGCPPGAAGIQAETGGRLAASPPRTRSSLRPIQVRFRPSIDSLGVCSCHLPPRPPPQLSSDPRPRELGAAPTAEAICPRPAPVQRAAQPGALLRALRRSCRPPCGLVPLTSFPLDRNRIIGRCQGTQLKLPLHERYTYPHPLPPERASTPGHS